MKKTISKLTIMLGVCAYMASPMQSFASTEGVISEHLAAPDSLNLDLKAMFPGMMIPFNEANYLTLALSSFNVETVENKFVLVDWQTHVSGMAPSDYTLQRWTESTGWADVQDVKGEPNTDGSVNYSLLDRNPVDGYSFYRLKHEDAQGNIYTTDIEAVLLYDQNKYNLDMDRSTAIALIDNLDKTNDLRDLQIFNVDGKDVTNRIRIDRFAPNKAKCYLETLPTGMYVFKSKDFLTKVFNLKV